MENVIVNEKCIGCGACIAIAPEIFESTDEGLAKVTMSGISPELKPKAVEAKESCPVEAIEIKEEI